MSERDTHFRGFAELLLAELYDNNLIEFAGDSEKLQLLFKTTTQRAYDLVNHTLWHSTPASGNTIKKYQGMTIEEITQHIPDLTAWPGSEQEQ